MYYKIIGINLVANTLSRQTQLAFRFPTVSRSQVSAQTMEAFSMSGVKKANSFPSLISTQSNEKDSDENLGTLKLELAKYQAYNLPSVLLAPLLIPHESLCNQCFQVTVDNIIFLGYPILLTADSSDKTQKDDFMGFSVSLVIVPTENDKCKATLDQFKVITKQIAIAYQHEQKRVGYVSSESQKMIDIRESWLEAQRPENVVKPDHQALTSQLLSVSTLTNELRTIYAGLRETGVVNIKLNHHIHLMFSLRDPWSVLTDVSFSTPKSSQISVFTGLRPYQTLLLLPPPHDPSSNQKKSLWESVLPDESSPLLKKFIEVVKPSKSFSMLQLETEIPLSQIYLFAAHLAYWNYGRIIHQLTKTNVYLVNPQYRTLKTTDPLYRYLSRDFSNTFAGFRFEDVLERFSDPKTLKDHLDVLVPALQRDFVDVVSWLLQRLIIVQLHTYIYCTVNLNKNPAEDKFSPITDKEVAIIENKGYDITDSPFEDFKRLFPYFNGKYHVEEIMWRENMTRDDIQKIFKKYSKLLVLCTHEGS